MECLPAELRAYIVEIICEDDDILAASASVRSILTLSRCWNVVASPFLYHTIVAVTSSKIRATFSRLNERPVNARRVRRLVISDELEESIEKQSHKYRTENTQDSKVIEGVINICRPTLRSLSLTVTSPFQSITLPGKIWTMHFPFLHTLEINGLYPHPVLPNNFPSLRNLRLEAWSNSHDLFFSGSLDIPFPALENLTFLFKTTPPSTSFVTALDYALHETRNSDFSRSCWLPYDQTVRMPPRLESLVVDMRNRKWKSDCKRFKESRPSLLSLQDKKSVKRLIKLDVLE